MIGDSVIALRADPILLSTVTLLHQSVQFGGFRIETFGLLFTTKVAEPPTQHAFFLRDGPQLVVSFLHGGIPSSPAFSVVKHGEVHGKCEAVALLI